MNNAFVSHVAGDVSSILYFEPPELSSFPFCSTSVTYPNATVPFNDSRFHLLGDRTHAVKYGVLGHRISYMVTLPFLQLDSNSIGFAGSDITRAGFDFM